MSEKIIYKYRLGMPGTTLNMQMSKDAKITLAGKQHGDYYMWVEFDADDALNRDTLPERTFVLWPTGQVLPDYFTHLYTFQEGDNLVWHLYEITKGA